MKIHICFLITTSLLSKRVIGRKFSVHIDLVTELSIRIFIYYFLTEVATAEVKGWQIFFLIILPQSRQDPKLFSSQVFNQWRKVSLLIIVKLTGSARAISYIN